VAQGQLLLEFDTNVLRYALGSYRDGVVDLSSVGRVDLPNDALERGVPTDPGQMAGLIRDLCQEHGLYANQVSVVLPLDAALVHVVELPIALSLDEAREQVLDPALGPQLPIPLIQTDFDLVPCHLPLRRTDDQQLLRRYLLVAVPRELTDKVLTTLELADLNLQRLELASLAALRLQQERIHALERAQFDLWLELMPGRTYCTVVADSGPVAQTTLVAIRDFPEPDLDDEQSAISLKEGLVGEDITVRDARYLPLSDLDLRVLVAEIQEFQARFAVDLPECHWSRLWLSGINSAHPLLEDLLGDQLDVGVQRIDPLADAQLGKVDYAQLLLSSGLSRLVGCGLGLMPQAKATDAGLVDDLSWQMVSDTPAFAALTVDEPITVDVVEIEPRDAASTGEEASVSEESPNVSDSNAGPDQRPDGDVENQSVHVDEESDGGEEDSASDVDAEKVEEWPSIQPIAEETDPMNLESAWPSIHPVERHQESAEQNVNSSFDVDESTGSLGELRFNDEDLISPSE